MATDTVQRVKAKLSIIDVVTPYVKLTRAGRHYRGLSPFNKEKTPSFFVSPDRGTYYCFSSNQGGDIFTFIEKMEGVDFKGALKILAEKAGVEIVYEGNSGADRSRSERLREAMAKASEFYMRGLSEGTPAYDYALSRGLSKETITGWQLGFAPPEWRMLLETLSGQGFTLDELKGAGLVKEADGKPGTYYDRFRNRLMFPIRDSAGRTAAFTGRSLDLNDQAKYLNSPETELYRKSEILFGMDRAKDAIRTRGFAILVEGQMDLLHAHQAGFTNSVALSGTALSPEHLALIRRYADNLMLALDGDRAGLAASAKSAVAALSAGLRVKAVRLPKGEDPADLISRDPKEFKQRVADAASIIEFFLSVLAEAEKDKHRLVMAAEKIVLPLLAAVRSPLEREHFVGIVARTLETTPEAVRAALPRQSVSVAARKSMTYAVGSPRQVLKDSQALQLRAAAACYAESLLAKRVKAEYERIAGIPLPGEAPDERAIFEIGQALGESPEEGAADDLIRAFELSIVREALAEATAALRKAEAAGDKDAADAAMKRSQELSVRLASLS
ncbi:MAG: DNA primase [bacterium]